MILNLNICGSDGTDTSPVLQNMRPVINGGVTEFHNVSDKKAYAAYGGWRPLLSLSDGTRTEWLFCRGSALAGGVLEADTTPLAFESAAPGTVSGAIPLCGGRALAVCSEGMLEVSLEGGVWRATPTSRRFPAVWFRTTSGGTLSHAVSSRSLGASYNGLASLGSSVRKSIENDFADAYRILCARAADSGLYTAPVLAWCRYLDCRGIEIFRTPPVAVCTGTSFDPWKQIAIENATTLGGYSVDVPCYGIDACFEACADSAVASVEIWMSPQLHPYRAGAPAHMTDVRGTALRVSLPGYVSGVYGGGRGAHRRMLRLLGHAESLCRCVMAVEHPFGGTARSMPVPHYGEADPGAEGAEADTAMSGRISRPTLPEVLLGAPHTTGAGAVACDASTVVYGNLHVQRFEGFSPLFFAHGTADKNWRAFATVTFAGDGRRGVTFGGEYGMAAPLSVGPVLCYPSPDAVEMRITVYNGSETRSRVFALEPDDSGRRAVYVSEGLESVELPVVSATLVSDQRPAYEEYPEMLAFASLATPLCMDAVSALPAPAWCIAAMPQADMSWEFGRSRFLCATSAGIISAALDKNRKNISVKYADHRRPSSADALSVSPTSVFAAVDGAVVEFTATGRRARRLVGGEFSSTVWDDRRRELMCFGDACCFVYCSDYGYCYTRPEYAGAVGIHAGGRAFVARRGLLEDVDTEDASTCVDICVEARHEVHGADVRPRALSIHCDGRLDEGMISMDANGSMVAQWRLGGNIRHPFAGRVLCRPVPRMRVVVEGSTDSLILRSIRVQA